MTMETCEAVLTEKRADSDKRSNETKCTLRQIFTSTGPMIATISAGMTSGYSAVLLPQLQIHNSTDQNSTFLNLTDYFNMNQLTVSGIEEESWIAASAALSMAPGCWLAGVMMDKFGRKGSYLIMCPFYFIGWLMVALAPSLQWLIIGRLLSGLCSGMNGPLGPVFIAETSEPSLRGILLAGVSLAIAVGILLSHVFGTWLHWRLSGLLCGLFPVVCFICCAIAPESPTWLVKRKKFTKAHKVWVSLRGKYSELEFEALKGETAKTQNGIDPEKELEISPETKSLRNDVAQNPPSSVWKTITSRGFLIPLIILNVYYFTSQFSGVNAVAFYSVTMLQEVAGRENAYTATIILDVIRVIFSVLACWLTRKYGRRSLTFVSGIGTAISLLFLSGSMVTEFGKPWLPICFLFAYMCIISIGIVHLPWLLCGELFAAHVRGLGSGLSSSFAFMFFFIVVKAAPAMQQNLGAPWTFAFYGVIAFAGTVFLYFFLPETKDKTLQEITERFETSDIRSFRRSKVSAPEEKLSSCIEVTAFNQSEKK